MKIYLIRHGNFTPMYDGDGFLNEKGIEQINRLRKRFIEEGVEFHRIYHSPLIRARDSANKLNMGKTVSINGLVETYQDKRDTQRAEEKDMYESDEEIVRRMRWSCLENIKSEFNEGCFGIISHCFAIRHFLNSFNPHSRLLPHAGVVLIDYSYKEPIILDYDSEKHLKGIVSS